MTLCCAAKSNHPASIRPPAHPVRVPLKGAPSPPDGPCSIQSGPPRAKSEIHDSDRAGLEKIIYARNQVFPYGRARNGRAMFPPDPNAVYRFWAPFAARHFYTVSASEKDKLVKDHPNVWTCEGVAWHAYGLRAE